MPFTPIVADVLGQYMQHSNMSGVKASEQHAGALLITNDIVCEAVP